MQRFIDNMRASSVAGKVFHTLDHCLQAELRDCRSVLDLGCGRSSPLRHCAGIDYSVGVEAFLPYLEETRRSHVHTEYLHADIADVDFPPGSFDAVILLEVLEHLPDANGRDILVKAESWARKKVIVSSPNGFFPMEAVDQNRFQKHVSGWDIRRLEKMGFNARGVSGARFLYSKENNFHSLEERDTLFANMRFRPKKLFYSLNALLQVFTYYFPAAAFGLFAVKRKTDA